MAGRYFNKNKLLEFCKRFTTSEFQQFLTFSKQNAENNKSLQKVSDFWQLIGLNYYYKQLQSKMERLVDDVELGFQALGRKVPPAGKQSLRQAKRNVQQLMLHSRHRIRQLEKDIVRIRDMLPQREATKYGIRSNQHQNIDTISMMEEGKLDRGVVQANFHTKVYGNTMLTHESHSTGKSTDSTKSPQITANIEKSEMQNLDTDKKLANDSSMVESAVSLRGPDADIQRSLILSADKGN